MVNITLGVFRGQCIFKCTYCVKFVGSYMSNLEMNVHLVLPDRILSIFCFIAQHFSTINSEPFVTEYYWLLVYLKQKIVKLSFLCPRDVKYRLFVTAVKALDCKSFLTLCSRFDGYVPLCHLNMLSIVGLGISYNEDAC